MEHQELTNMAGSAEIILDELGFSPRFSMGQVAWPDVPDTPGAYVISDEEEVIYVGMAGRNGNGTLRSRLRDHASGQIVNMFAQYLLFARLLGGDTPPRTPREANLQCRAYIRAHCSARVLATPKAEARGLEDKLRRSLKPTFNAPLRDEAQ